MNMEHAKNEKFITVALDTLSIIGMPIHNCHTWHGAQSSREPRWAPGLSSQGGPWEKNSLFLLLEKFPKRLTFLSLHPSNFLMTFLFYHFHLNENNFMYKFHVSFTQFPPGPVTQPGPLKFSMTFFFVFSFQLKSHKFVYFMSRLHLLCSRHISPGASHTAGPRSSIPLTPLGPDGTITPGMEHAIKECQFITVTQHSKK